MLVPVHQVGEQRKVAGIEGVEAGGEDVGDLAFIDEGGDLGFAHGELGAGLYLHIEHGISIGEDAVFRLVPLNDLDKLFYPQLAETHFDFLLDASLTCMDFGANNTKEADGELVRSHPSRKNKNAARGAPGGFVVSPVPKSEGPGAPRTDDG